METTKHQHRKKSGLPRRHDGQGGFTLLEVVTVVAIVALVAAIALPLMTDFVPKRQLKGAARDLYSAMMRAKAEALRRGAMVAVHVNPDERHFYRLFVDNSVSGTGNGRIDDNEETLFPLPGSLPGRVIFLNTTASDERMTNNLGYVGNYLDSDKATARPAKNRSTVLFDHRGLPFFPVNPNSPANGHVTLCVARSSTNEDGVGDNNALKGYKEGMTREALIDLRDRQCLVIKLNKGGRVRMMTYGQYCYEKYPNSKSKRDKCEG